MEKENTQTVGWIEERGAKVGLFVELKEHGDGGFWKVTEVYAHRMNEEVAKNQERAYLRQRAASDI